MASRDDVDLKATLIGATVGCGLVKLAALVPGIAQRWPLAFSPFWRYFPPIALIGAAVGGVVSAAVGPTVRAKGTGLAGSGLLIGMLVGIVTCLTALPGRPSVLMIILLTFAYGLVGSMAAQAVVEEDPDKDLRPTLIGAVVGCILVKLAALAPEIAQRWPQAFKPLWRYFPPIALISAFAGGAVVATVARARSIDKQAGFPAGMLVGLVTCLTVLPERPSIMLVIVLAIAYGLVGEGATSAVANLRSSKKAAAP